MRGRASHPTVADLPREKPETRRKAVQRIVWTVVAAHDPRDVRPVPSLVEEEEERGPVGRDPLERDREVHGIREAGDVLRSRYG